MEDPPIDIDAMLEGAMTDDDKTIISAPNSSFSFPNPNFPDLDPGIVDVEADHLHRFAVGAVIEEIIEEEEDDRLEAEAVIGEIEDVLHQMEEEDEGAEAVIEEIVEEEEVIEDGRGKGI
uniref:Ovule protein n=1 Tax=Caenorhabditis tropicalis TaxID=1561998 RepID=A0A1I7UZ77_9PELO